MGTDKPAPALGFIVIVILGFMPRISLIARFSAFVAKNIQQVVHYGS
jgi:hypothetical protein